MVKRHKTEESIKQIEDGSSLCADTKFKSACVANSFRAAMKRYYTINCTKMDSGSHSENKDAHRKQSIASSYSILAVVFDWILGIKKWLANLGPYPSFKAYTCIHLALINAAQVNQILKKKLNFRMVHDRNSVHSQSREFEYWKAQILTWDRLQFEDQGVTQSIKLLKLKEGLVNYSANMPWIYAAPDLVASVNENGISGLVIIKIVVTEDEEMYHQSVYKYDTEIQITLDCFGVNAAYLITCLIDKKDVMVAKGLRLDKIQRSFKILNDSKLLIRAYSLFLVNEIQELTGNTIPQELIIARIKEQVSEEYTCSIKDFDSLLKRPQHEFDTRCEYEMLLETLKVKKRGRPKKYN